MKPTKEQLETAIEAAKTAFWRSIGTSFPECKSGDFPPAETAHWDGAADRAVEMWLRYNHPVLSLPWFVEFPDYDEMPAELVEAFKAGRITDSSWHNDSCPSFASKDRERHMHVDFKDMALREHPGGARFYVWSTPGGQYHSSPEEQPLYEGDDVNAALKILLNS